MSPQHLNYHFVFLRFHSSLLNRRYDIDAGPAAHISATCIVMFATDYTNYNKTESSSSSNLQAARGRRVALKLMHSRSQFFNELKCRSGLDKNHVVPVIRVHVEEDQKEQVKETRKNAGDIEVHPEKQSLAYALHMAMQRKADELEAGSAGARAGTDVAGTNYAKWLEDDPDEVYCLVMDLADRNLSMAIMHERFTGRAKELHTIKKVCLDIAEALRHLHQDGKLAHCDMKPLNAVRVWQCWKVIDMDVSCQLGQPFGDKAPSSGYCPPEMAKLLLECTPSDKSRLKTYKGSEAYDMWSLGCVLFHLCTSETMWHTDQDDNVKEDDLKVIAALSLQSKHALEQRLMLVKQRLADAPKQADLAYDLLQKLLQPSPEDRIRDLGTMTGVCKHPFLEGGTHKKHADGC